MKRILIGAGSVVSLFVSAAFILPALAQVKEYGGMPASSVGLYTIGLALGFSGVGAGVYAVLRRRA
jgi:hypothetical protein